MLVLRDKVAFLEKCYPADLDEIIANSPERLKEPMEFWGNLPNSRKMLVSLFFEKSQHFIRKTCVLITYPTKNVSYINRL